MSDSRWPPSIEAINALDDAAKMSIYRTLIPDWVYERFGVTRDTLSVDGHPVVEMRCPAGSRGLEITIRHQAGARDPLVYLNMADTSNNQLVVLLLVVNDPAGPRFDIDVLPDGTLTSLGTTQRNHSEEQRALAYGLAPGQICPGLRVFRQSVPIFEQFVARMGHDLFFIEPMAYHNAISFERYGFAYTRGRAAMERLHLDFMPGRILHTRLDDSTPFRSRNAWESVRGRSWAIQDGITGEPFNGFQMYKRIGQNAGVNTFPGSRW